MMPDHPFVKETYRNEPPQLVHTKLRKATKKYLEKKEDKIKNIFQIHDWDQYPILDIKMIDQTPSTHSLSPPDPNYKLRTTFEIERYEQKAPPIEEVGLDMDVGFGGSGEVLRMTRPLYEKLSDEGLFDLSSTVGPQGNDH